MVVTRKPIETWKIKKDLIDDCNAMFPKKNIVCVNKGDETIDHFVTKAMCMHILRGMGIEAYSEVKLGAGIVDILTLSSNGNLIIELETELTEEGKQAKVDKYDNAYVKDFIFIDLKLLPAILSMRYDILKQKIQDVKSD
jgi:Ni2+-binding GTPase involved in maturation of urease and hydrogenase